MRKREKQIDNYHNKEIQEKANNLLRSVISNFSESQPDLYWAIRSEEDQHDRGIDFNVEIVNKITDETIFILKIQNKGSSGELKPLKTTVNKGLLSYPISIRHVKYYRYEIPVTLIFTVCDLKTSKVYWHPIQIDTSIDELVRGAKEEDEYVRLYIQPDKWLSVSNLSTFLEDVRQSFKEQVVRFPKNIKHDLLVEKSSISIDTKQHILDQIYTYLRWWFSQLRFIPVNILIRSYPFKVDGHLTYYEKFSIITANAILIDLFKQFEVRNHNEIVVLNDDYFKQVTDYQNKLDYVLRTLSNNLIFEIQDTNHRTVCHFHVYDQHNNHALDNLFIRLQFSELTKELTETPKSIFDKISFAYYEYKLGNYLRSINHYYEVLLHARKEGKLELYYLCQYNLSNLSIFARRDYNSSITNERDRYILSSIDLEQSFQLSKTLDNEKLLSWIKNNSFYSGAKEKIAHICHKIVDQYYGGSVSSTNYATELTNEYASLDYFVKNNYIVFDKFYDYEECTERFVEGVFASLGTRKSNIYKLEEFDDWIINRLIIYADQKAINKYFNRYQLTEIKYRKTSHDNDSFKDVVFIFLNDVTELSKVKLGESGHRFRTNYCRYFETIIELCNLCSIDDDFIRMIEGSLIAFLEKDKRVDGFHLRGLEQFLTRKKKQLSKSFVSNLFDFFLRDGRIHNAEILEGMYEFIQFTGEKIEINDQSFNIVKEILLGTCYICNKKHDIASAPLLYHMLKNDVQADEIRSMIEHKLHDKFDPHLFYISAMYEVLNFEDSFKEQMIGVASSILDKPLFSWTNEEFPTYRLVDSLVNLCFKYEVDIRSLGLEKIQDKSSYYGWLFNMDNFDYKEWNPNWLSIYPTKYYFAKFRTVAAIKHNLRQYLLKRRDPKIERLYFNLYGLEDN